MGFPKFLRIASMPRTELVNINETTAIEKQIYDTHDDLLTEILSQKLGFSYELVTPPDGEWGRLLPDGNFTGMVRMVQRREADLIIRSLSITEERSREIDFSFPYSIQPLLFATRRLEPSVDTQSFLKPFSPEVWICLTVCVFLMPVIVFVLFQRKYSLRHLKTVYAFFSKNSINSPKSVGEYILRTCWAIFLTIFCWSYTALLLSFLTLPSLSGVRDIPELANAIQKGKFQCSAFPGTFTADILINSPDSNLRIIGLSVGENEGYVDIDAALRKKKVPKKPAYIEEESRFLGLETKYFVSNDVFFSDLQAIGIRKDFCCKDELSDVIHLISSSGIFLKLIKDYRGRATRGILWNSSEIDEDNTEKSLSLTDFQGVFFLLAAGYSLAVVVFFLELIFGKS